MGSSQSQSPQSKSVNVKGYDLESWSAGDQMVQDYLKEVSFALTVLFFSLLFWRIRDTVAMPRSGLTVLLFGRVPLATRLG